MKRFLNLSHSEFPNLHILDHPLIKHKLTLMRSKETHPGLFRQLMKEISVLMGYEVTRQLETKDVTIETPLSMMTAPKVSIDEIVIVPILRAGLGMVQGLLELMPNAKEGHIGLYRDKVTKLPHEYLVNLPKVNNRTFILVDPTLATGNSAVHAVDVMVKHGVARAKIMFVTIVTIAQGIKVFNKSHPTIPIYAASLDDKLNDHAYIVPGLGDAGDRLFGTKQ